MLFFIYFNKHTHSFTLIAEGTSSSFIEATAFSDELIDTFESSYQEVQLIYNQKINDFYKKWLLENS
jgi:hypothetical protein